MTVTINTHDVALQAGATISISSLIASIGSDSDSDAITSWTFITSEDPSLSGDGHFNINGIAQTQSSGYDVITVPESELNGVTYTAGAANSGVRLSLVAHNDLAGTSAINSSDVTINPVVGDQNPSIVPFSNFSTTVSPEFYAFKAGGTGDQNFIGNGLHDTISMPGAAGIDPYTITPLINGSVAFENKPGTTFTVRNIEQVTFTDFTLFIENSDNANIARLYSAAFDRVPDLKGLAFWEDVYTSNVPFSAKAAGYYVALAQTNDGSGVTIADGFMQSSEFTERYGTLTDTGFVDALYQNVLRRLPDQAGLNFWLNQLSHDTTRAMVLVGFAESPENVQKTAYLGGGWLIQV